MRSWLYGIYYRNLTVDNVAQPLSWRIAGSRFSPQADRRNSHDLSPVLALGVQFTSRCVGLSTGHTKGLVKPPKIIVIKLLRIVVYLWTSPTTLAGCLLLVPTLCTGGRCRVVDGALEVWGGFTTFFLKHCTLLKGGATAMTLGHIVLARDEMAHDLTRSHERIHVKQAEQWGPLFLPAYGMASLIALLRGKRPYRDNYFEREAYDREGV